MSQQSNLPISGELQPHHQVRELRPRPAAHHPEVRRQRPGQDPPGKRGQRWDEDRRCGNLIFILVLNVHQIFCPMLCLLKPVIAQGSSVLLIKFYLTLNNVRLLGSSFFSATLYPEERNNILEGLGMIPGPLAL